jgi:hypothetical protein
MSVELNILDRLKALQHQPNHEHLLGCSICPHYDVCGGISPNEPIFSCRELCPCTRGEPCNAVCPKHLSNFVRYLREIDGFDLQRLPRLSRLPSSDVAAYAPLIYRWNRRQTPVQATTVAVPMAMLFSHRTGKRRFQSCGELLNRFRVSTTAQLVISGVDEDARVENYWGMARDAGIVTSLKSLNPALVTVPNFSLLSNVPRHDNLANMKRIAIAWHELIEAGVQTALHVNARTEHDWHRWNDFVREREEVQWISFEFGTGARVNHRGDWYAQQLCEVAKNAGRPLRIAIRGSMHLSVLRESFERVLVIDSTPYHKTLHRQRARVMPSGEVRWHRGFTLKGQLIDHLLQDNLDAVQASQIQTACKSATQRAVA